MKRVGLLFLLFLLGSTFVIAGSANIVIDQGDRFHIGMHLRDIHGWPISGGGLPNSYHVIWGAPDSTYDRTCFLSNWSNHPVANGKNITAASMNFKSPHKHSPVSHGDNCVWWWSGATESYRCYDGTSYDKGPLNCHIEWEDPVCSVEWKFVDLSDGACTDDDLRSFYLNNGTYNLVLNSTPGDLRSVVTEGVLYNLETPILDFSKGYDLNLDIYRNSVGVPVTCPGPLCRVTGGPKTVVDPSFTLSAPVTEVNLSNYQGSCPNTVRYSLSSYCFNGGACTPRTCADYPVGTCGVQSNGCGGTIDCGPVLLNLKDTTNSLVENGSEFNFVNQICAPVSSCNIGTNDFMYLSDITNSLASTTPDATYDVPICSDNCIVELNACSDPAATIVASMLAQTNSHMAVGNDPTHQFKVCCGPGVPVIGNYNYWAYPDGTEAANGDVFYKDSDVLMMSDAGPLFTIYDGDDLSNNQDLIFSGPPFIWQPDFFDNNLFFSSSALPNSRNFIETVPTNGPTDLEIKIIEPECGRNLSKGDDLKVKFEIVNKYNVVTGNLTIGDNFYEFDNRVDGSIIEIIQPITEAGNLQIVLNGNNSLGEYTRAIVNTMIFDPTNNTDQYYVASCIYSPEQFQEFDTSEIKFLANNTRAIKYNPLDPNDGVTEIPIDDLYFEWIFLYFNGAGDDCDGLGRDFCTDQSNNPEPYNMYNFTKIFPTVNENNVYLTVSIPPEAKG